MEVAEDAYNGIPNVIEKNFIIFFNSATDEKYCDLFLGMIKWKLHFRFSHKKCEYCLELVQNNLKIKSLPIFTELNIGFRDDTKYVVTMKRVSVKFSDAGEKTSWNSVEMPSDAEVTCICDMRLSFGLSAKKQAVNIKIPESTFTKDISRSFGKEIFSDVNIVVSGRTIPAHRVILSARSPVFASLLETNNNEDPKGTTSIEIDGVSYDAMMEVMSFIYTDCAQNLAENASDILIIADRYELDRLKSQCEEVLLKKMDVENASEMLVAGSTYNADQLKVGAKKFINLNFLEVKKTPGFHELATTHPHLLLEVLQCYDGAVAHIRNQTVFKCQMEKILI